MSTRDNLLRFHASRRRIESLIVVGLIVAGLGSVFLLSYLISLAGVWLG